jgi:hypothetical protein
MESLCPLCSEQVSDGISLDGKSYHDGCLRSKLDRKHLWEYDDKIYNLGATNTFFYPSWNKFAEVDGWMWSALLSHQILLYWC